MIKNIKTKGFHGPDISQPCSNKMFFAGQNRSGKTTRTNAIHLCLNGFVATAHRVSKKASADTLNQYAKGDQLTCAIEIDNTEFEFHISRDSKGKTSKRFRVDKKKYSEKEYMTELALSGNPKIIDLESFIQISDAKKIDQLFKLYPGKVDIRQINTDILLKESKISRIKSDIKAKENVIRENTKSKQAIELPAGTLAEVRDELENHKTAYRGTRDKIAVIEAEEKRKFIKPDPEPKPQQNATYNEPAPLPSGTFSAPDEKEIYPVNNMQATSGTSLIDELKITMEHDHVESLQKILKVMESTDCSMCVASIVCKKEIREARK